MTEEGGRAEKTCRKTEAQEFIEEVLWLVLSEGANREEGINRDSRMTKE